MRFVKQIGIGIALMLAVLLAACRGEPSPTAALPTATPSLAPASPTVTAAAATATPETYPYPPNPNLPPPVPPTSAPAAPTASPAAYPEPATPTELASANATPTDTPTSPASVEASPTPTHFNPGEIGYPGPETPVVVATPTYGAGGGDSTYPGPATATPAKPPTATLKPGTLPSATATPAPSATATRRVFGSGTPQVTPTERIGQPVQSPPPPGTTIRIWHAWSAIQVEALEVVIESFQDFYPDVYFDVLYVPEEELRGRYETEAYSGGGPSLVLGPAEWGSGWYDGALVTDLTPYISPQLLEVLNPPALGTVQYREALVCLPYALEGVVLYRNTALIAEAPQTFEELVTLADEATYGGDLGAFLERGALFSLANLNSLGGQLMDADFNPAFNSDAGLAWLDLLADYDRAGAPTFNNDRDLELFMEGRIGFIVDGTWSLRSLAEAIGPENLAIDAWPTYQEGRMSGFVQSECAYLNINSAGDEQYAALVFMAYLLDANVQHLLAEVEYIPAVVDAEPRDLHFQQAVLALAGGTATPLLPSQYYWSAYLDALDAAIVDVFENGVDPAAALQAAYDTITARLVELRGAP